jgi:hypothetical protein
MSTRAPLTAGMMAAEASASVKSKSKSTARQPQLAISGAYCAALEPVPPEPELGPGGWNPNRSTTCCSGSGSSSTWGVWQTVITAYAPKAAVGCIACEAMAWWPIEVGGRRTQAPDVHRFLAIFRRTVPMAIPNLQDIAVNL